MEEAEDRKAATYSDDFERGMYYNAYTLMGGGWTPPLDHVCMLDLTLGEPRLFSVRPSRGSPLRHAASCFSRASPSHRPHHHQGLTIIRGGIHPTAGLVWLGRVVSCRVVSYGLVLDMDLTS